MKRKLTEGNTIQQVKQNAHQQPTIAQPVPEWYFPPKNLPGFIAECDALWCGVSLWSAVLAVSPPGFLYTPSQHEHTKGGQ